ncbi:hypothetical protein SAMN05216388_1004264 [Halorientalis persicus]|uniref:Uncharacterized protein n=1 Tax=Halorientalis persicus TaxID=1367881 RepID=A0A1H8IT50_9EURY|nr:hypothetical protein [Halorientalis persicus]SEN71581.1 hypothetical protein SAMN05216388_1004264 [Halorientalis persicus]
MSRLAPVLLCCAVLAAGCAGFAADDPETPGPVSVPEVTVPTPEATPTATARSRIAPGATRAGVVDPDALVTGHVERLRNASALFTYERTVTAANGTVRRRVIDGRVDRGANTTTTWTVTTASDDGTRTEARSGDNRSFSPSFRDRLGPVLSAVELVRADNPSGVPLRTTTYYYRANATTATVFGERARNVSVLLEVEPSGVVMSYRLRYERVGTGERVVERLNYGAVWFGND